MSTAIGTPYIDHLFSDQDLTAPLPAYVNAFAFSFLTSREVTGHSDSDDSLKSTRTSPSPHDLNVVSPSSSNELPSLPLHSMSRSQSSPNFAPEVVVRSILWVF